MKLCTKNGLHLICDEIYALSVWDNPRLPNAPKFKSILSMEIAELMNPSMVHVVWGLSKVRTPSPLPLSTSNMI
jgi:aspartate/methionine/tyrosine aminotransferase